MKPKVMRVEPQLMKQLQYLLLLKGGTQTELLKDMLKVYFEHTNKKIPEELK